MSKKRNYKTIIRIILLFITACLVVGIFQLIKYVPSVKEAIILVTTVKPETFTELYFENHLSLPDRITLFNENNFKFTIHNLEGKDMEYAYEVYIDINEERQIIDNSSVLIKKNEYKTFMESFTITVPVQRVKVVVNLTNNNKNQEIVFWMTAQ